MRLIAMKIMALMVFLSVIGGCSDSTVTTSGIDGDQNEMDAESETDFPGLDGDLDGDNEGLENEWDEMETEGDSEESLADGDTDEISEDGDFEPDGENEADEDDVPGLQWASIPSGDFYMGCQPGDEECNDQELPTISVTVSAFQMMTTEVTQAQYEQVIGNNPSGWSDCGPQCPVENVSWYEAHDFCAAIGARLPSHAEWEYSARAGHAGLDVCEPYPDCLDDYAWLTFNSGEYTHPVAQKLPNDWGLYDISGNVGEYVEDCYSGTLEDLPRDGSPRIECRTGKIIRTGSSYWSPTSILSRYEGREPDNPWRHIGFRCARDNWSSVTSTE